MIFFHFRACVHEANKEHESSKKKEREKKRICAFPPSHTGCLVPEPKASWQGEKQRSCVRRTVQYVKYRQRWKDRGRDIGEIYERQRETDIGEET